MEAKSKRTVGITTLVAGLGVVVAAWLFGFTKADGGVDWVDVIMACAGFIMLMTGLVALLGPGRGHPAT
jgi:hypothetical protein